MKAKATVLFAAVFLILFKSFGDDTNDVSNVFGGKAAAAIIANADSVKAWRTLGSIEIEQYGHKYEGKRFNINPADLYRKSGKGILVSTNSAAELGRLLLDKNSYPPPGLFGKNCEPEPGVVVTFSQGNKGVDVFFWFECKILVVNNMQTDFDPSCAAFLKIIKNIFPNDRKIQSLTDS